MNLLFEKFHEKACFSFTDLFFSGAYGLFFELIWSRRLKLLFGATVYAVVTVLAVYMSGLALGSLLFSRRAKRAERPIFMLSLVLTDAGLTVAAVPPVLDTLQKAYLDWIGSLVWGSPAAAS
jgi:spermidine synthase